MLETELPDVSALNGAGSDPLPKEIKTRVGFILAQDTKPILNDTGLIDGVIQDGTLNTVIGEPNSGKSTLVLDMCLKIATGEPWLNKKVIKGGSIYGACEAGWTISNRVYGYLKHHDLVGEKIPFATVPHQLDFCTNEKDVNTFIDIVKKFEDQTGEKCRLIALDTVARLLAGGDENSSTDMGSVVRNVDLLREKCDCAVVLVHHVGKDPSKGGRGHSNLNGAIDTGILCVDRTVKILKQRDQLIIPPFGFNLRPVTVGLRDDGGEVTCCVVESREVGPLAASRRTSEVALQAQEVLRSLSKQYGDQVSVDSWRDRFFEIHYAGSPRSTRSSAFRRAVTELHSGGSISLGGGAAWLDQKQLTTPGE